MADVCIALPNSSHYRSKTFLWNIYKNDVITCHGATEGKRNKHSVYELSLSFSASVLSKAELSLLIKAVSSLWFGTCSLCTYHSCWTPQNHSQFCWWFLMLFLCLVCLKHKFLRSGAPSCCEGAGPTVGRWDYSCAWPGHWAGYHTQWSCGSAEGSKSSCLPGRPGGIAQPTVKAHLPTLGAWAILTKASLVRWLGPDIVMFQLLACENI